ncbi:hypothetical protein [Natrialba swarupiae]|uniref:Uncharacterized protein n=1 Tax=Natrialba swarupiae TaxID=2448032 RepID=A0A5D5ASJ6_9EURY|nr:hypothetical protein [Natrialba swarupiae]TYT63835.1 hypothetical protein FYC77_01035 [Natrialba swarupiae]
MTQRIPNITRRRLLASTGTAGIAVLAGLSFRPATVSGDTPPYTDTTYAQTDVDGLSLRVAWHSTYNDRTVSASLDSSDGRTVPGHTEPNETGQDPSDGFTDGGNAETHGPLIAASNVLPGDSGTIAIGLFAERMDARVRLIPTVSGRLSEIVDIALWYDTGLFGIGGCRGSETIPDDPAFESTLAAFGETYGQAIDGTTGDGLALRNGVRSCLPEGERLCLGFAWKIDESVGNEWQGESLEFGLAFAAESCGGVV